jgi:hypothetical protein
MAPSFYEGGGAGAVLCAAGMLTSIVGRSGKVCTRSCPSFAGIITKNVLRNAGLVTHDVLMYIHGTVDASVYSTTTRKQEEIKTY